MEKISVFNAKGGVAKTTSAVNFASVLAEQGNRVLVVDMDPQSNTTMIFTDEDQEFRYHIGHLLDEEEEEKLGIRVEDVLLKTRYSGIDLLPAKRPLRLVEKTLLGATTSCAQRRLEPFLSQLEGQYDYCIIDCPPQVNLTVVNALVASDRVIVPVKVDKYALEGLEELLDEIEKVRKHFNPNLVFSGCFLTMDAPTVVNREVKAALKETLGDLLFDTTIRQNVKVIESTFERMPVNTYRRYCNASMDYRKLAKEIFS